LAHQRLQLVRRRIGQRRPKGVTVRLLEEVQPLPKSAIPIGGLVRLERPCVAGPRIVARALELGRRGPRITGEICAPGPIGGRLRRRFDPPKAGRAARAPEQRQDECALHLPTTSSCEIAASTSVQKRRKAAYSSRAILCRSTWSALFTIT